MITVNTEPHNPPRFASAYARMWGNHVINSNENKCHASLTAGDDESRTALAFPSPRTRAGGANFVSAWRSSHKFASRRINRQPLKYNSPRTLITHKILVWRDSFGLEKSDDYLWMPAKGSCSHRLSNDCNCVPLR